MAFQIVIIYKFKTIQNLKSPSYWLISISYLPVFGINQLVDCIVHMTFVLTECSTTKPSSETSHMVNLPHGWYPCTRSFFATLSSLLKQKFTVCNLWLPFNRFCGNKIARNIWGKCWGVLINTLGNLLHILFALLPYFFAFSPPHLSGHAHIERNNSWLATILLGITTQCFPPNAAGAHNRIDIKYSFASHHQHGRRASQE